jgi:hypothetical protein
MHPVDDFLEILFQTGRLRRDPIVCFGFENHAIRGKAKMQTRVGLAMAVMMAMALGHVKTGRVEQMRSVVRPIPTTG